MRALRPTCQALFAGAVVLLLLIFLYQAGIVRAGAQAVGPARVAAAEQVTVTRFDHHRLRQGEQPYSITAQNAVQDKDMPNCIHLDDVDGRHPTATTARPSPSRRNNGLYDTDVKTLDLEGDVEISRPSRFIGRMDKAHVIVGQEAADQQYAG